MENDDSICTSYALNSNCAYMEKARVSLDEKDVGKENFYVLHGTLVGAKSYTSGLQPVYDRRFAEAVRMTLMDAVRNFNATTGYAHSCDICLLFNPGEGGRIDVISSTFSSYISVRFNVHIAKQFEDTYHNTVMLNVPNTQISTTLRDWIPFTVYKSHVVDRMRAHTATFAAHLVVMGRPYDYFLSMQRQCLQKSVFLLCKAFFSAEEMLGKSTPKLVKMLETVDQGFCGKDPQFTMGVFAKKCTSPVPSMHEFYSHGHRTVVKSFYRRLPGHMPHTQERESLVELSKIFVFMEEPINEEQVL